MNFKASLLTIILLLLFLGKGFSQTYKGRIWDAENHTPIPFVSVLYDEENHLGTISNIDGYFTIPSPLDKELNLHFSCMSYVDTFITLDNRPQDLNIVMRKELYEIAEVRIYPKENPAFAILRKVHKNKKSNNPENISNFECKEYSQTILRYYFSGIDDKDNKALPQTAEKFEDKDGLFFETSYEHKYNSRTKHHLKVEATRFPGMKEVPVYLPNDFIQPFHFYNDYVLLGDKKYLNPLADKNFSRYQFYLKDSLYVDNIKTYIIDYFPKSELRYDALKGQLVISSYNWAIKSVTAKPFREDNIEISILQNYNIIDEQWFPVELNYVMHYVGLMSVPPFSYIGKTYISNVKIDSIISQVTNYTNTIDINENAASRDTAYWSAVRPVPLTQRQINTFTSLDTLANFDKIPFIIEKLIELQLPLKIFDIDMTKLYNKNDFEGDIFGFGASTNERFSKRFSIGGFCMYGALDEEFKYGAELEVNIAKRTNFKTYLSYNNSYLKDDYFQEKSVLSGNISTGNTIYNQDFLKNYQLGFKNTLKRFEFEYYVASQRYTTYSEITYLNDVTEDVFAAGIYASFDYYKKNMPSWISPYKSIDATSVSENKFIPQVKLFFERGFEFDKYNYNYSKLQLELESTFYITKLGRVHYSLQSGKIWKDIPISKVFRGGNRYAQNSFLLYEDAFQTVSQNEFSNSEYIYLFMNYKFGSVNFKSDYFLPQMVFYQNIGVGKENNSYIFEDTKAMENFLLESGIGMENIIRVPIFNAFYVGSGIAAFCRYGNHSNAGGIGENIAIKAILSITY